jgi:phosphate transport system substrate-binding protein
MKKTKFILSFVLALLISTNAFAKGIEITGAGASFPAPIYTKWAEQYKIISGDSLNYASIGSGGGVKQIKEKTVDFGATDNPLKGDELEKDGMVQFPAIIGGVVVIFNLEGFKPGELKIDGDTTAKIFAGEIEKWNDKQIAALNPGKKLPDQAITVVTRSDSSGTTKIYTDYLSAVSSSWKEKIGSGGTVNWTAKSTTGGKGNEGVAANVTRIKGAIGYVEYAYAKINNIPYLSMKNLDGKYVLPSLESFGAAAANANWSGTPGMGITLVNQKGEKSWPITGASFILMYKDSANKEKSNAALKFFEWSFKNGGKSAAELDYVALPANVTDYISKNVWSQIKK